MKVSIVALFSLAMSVLPLAADLVDVPAVLERDGMLVLSDGSSVFLFHPDGAFEMGPIGMSGRTIKGRWKEDRPMLIVQGTWSAVNGISREGDIREMTIFLGWLASDTYEVGTAFHGKLQVHKAYFTIEALSTKAKAAEPGATDNPGDAQ
jgi:hypothetical protein